MSSLLNAISYVGCIYYIANSVLYDNISLNGLHVTLVAKLHAKDTREGNTRRIHAKDTREGYTRRISTKDKHEGYARRIRAKDTREGDAKK
jgi:hypothetical protein